MARMTLEKLAMTMQSSFEELRAEFNMEFRGLKQDIAYLAEGQRILRRDMEAGFERIDRRFDALMEDHVLLKEQVGDHEFRLQQLEDG